MRCGAVVLLAFRRVVEGGGVESYLPGGRDPIETWTGASVVLGTAEME